VTRDAEDVRLDALPGSGIVASLMMYHGGLSIWRAYHLQLVASSTAIRAQISTLVQSPGISFTASGAEVHGSMAEVVNGGRNFGLLMHDHKLRRLVWVSQPLQIVPAEADAAVGWPTRALTGRLLTRRHPEGNASTLFTLHNSVSPIRINENELLLLAHFHGARGGDGVRKTSHGANYAQVFLIARASPPWQVTSQSSAWCLPSPGDPTRYAAVL
jgi:hypothetical protein